MDRHFPRTSPAPTGDAWLGLAGTRRTLATGQLLFRQGTRTGGVFRLAAGAIRLQRCTAGGSVVTMHSVREGELFAEASLFSPRYHCDAIAQAPSEVLVFPRAQVLQAFAECPSSLLAFSAGLAHRLQSLRQLTELRQVRPAQQRVLRYLQLHGDAQGGWTAPGTLKQWAEDLALTHEALYRTLGRLTRAGVLTRDGARLQLVRQVARQAGQAAGG